MAGIPLKNCKLRREKKKRESKETKRKNNAYKYRQGHVTRYVINTWPVTLVRKIK